MARSLVDRLSEVEGVEVVIAPPFTSLYPVGQIIKGSKLGLAGQNFYFESKGAYTGEVSLEMLRDVGCGFALIGHSERRSLFGESDAGVNPMIPDFSVAGGALTLSFLFPNPSLLVAQRGVIDWSFRIDAPVS